MTRVCPQCDRLSSNFRSGVCQKCDRKNQAVYAACGVMFDRWERVEETRAGREVKEIRRIAQEVF